MAFPMEKRAQRETRRKIVADNVLGGMSYRAIGAALGVSEATVHRDFQATLQEWQQERVDVADRYVDIQLRRYHILLNTVWAEAVGGADKPPNKDALASALQILGRIDNLTGIERRANVTVNNTQVNNTAMFNIDPVDYRSAISALAPSQDMIDAMPVEMED